MSPGQIFSFLCACALWLRTQSLSSAKILGRQKLLKIKDKMFVINEKRASVSFELPCDHTEFVGLAMLFLLTETLCLSLNKADL